jgi:hypothetical protein
MARRPLLEEVYEDLEAARALPDNEVFHELMMLRRYLQDRGCPDAELAAWCEKAAEVVLARDLSGPQIIDTSPLERVWSSMVFLALDTELPGIWPEAPLRNLVELQLRGADIEWSAQPRCDWPRLRELYCFDDGPVARGFFGWLAAQDLPSLRKVSVHGHGVMTADFHALLRSSFWPGLETIDLQYNRFGPGPAPWPAHLATRKLELNNIGADDEGIGSLLASTMPHLGHLDVSGNAITRAGLQKLVAASLPELRHLSARGAKFDDEAIWAVLAEARWPLLEHLDIRSDGSDPDELCRASALFASAASLDLGDCRLGDRGTAALAALPFSRLSKLHLAYNRIGVDGARALAGAALPDLRELDLSVNVFGDAGLHALTEAPWWRRLRRLSLVNIELTDAGVDVLAAAVPPAIEELGVSVRRFGEASVARLQAAMPAGARLH